MSESTKPEPPTLLEYAIERELFLVIPANRDTTLSGFDQNRKLDQ